MYRIVVNITERKQVFGSIFAAFCMLIEMVKF